MSRLEPYHVSIYRTVLAIHRADGDHWLLTLDCGHDRTLGLGEMKVEDVQDTLNAILARFSPDGQRGLGHIGRGPVGRG